jgi:serine/threonine-protein kinase
VPPELERLINRALARDPVQRYQTARELGVDLSKMLYKLGTPVSNFEIANLVIGAMRDRQRMRPQQASIIDKLIEEALLEFTSLTDEQKAAQQQKGAAPINFDGGRIGGGGRPAGPGDPGYVNIGDWLDEMSHPGRPRDDAVRASLPPGLSEGNLSALEDDPAPIPPSHHPIVQSVQSSPVAIHNAPPAPSSRRVLAQEPVKKKGGAAVVGVVAAFVVLAAAAAAWFTHIIPH